MSGYLDRFVAEARSHAAETGRTLAEEFGTPEHYANQFGMDRARRSRLTIALLALLIGLNVMLQVDGWSWTGSAAMLLLAWMTWQEYRKYRKHQERRRTWPQSTR